MSAYAIVIDQRLAGMNITPIWRDNAEIYCVATIQPSSLQALKFGMETHVLAPYETCALPRFWNGEVDQAYEATD